MRQLFPPFPPLALWCHLLLLPTGCLEYELWCASYSPISAPSVMVSSLVTSSWMSGIWTLMRQLLSLFPPLALWYHLLLLPAGCLEYELWCASYCPYFHPWRYDIISCYFQLDVWNMNFDAPVIVPISTPGVMISSLVTSSWMSGIWSLMRQLLSLFPPLALWYHLLLLPAGCLVFRFWVIQ